MNSDNIILIIDDDPDDREIFTEVLQEINPELECIVAHDGHDGIKKLLELNETPSYIFLDLNMPRMNGKQCLLEIKQNANLKHIPVVIFSTSNLPSDIDEAKSMGAAYYLIKPSLFRDLKDAISMILTGDKSQVAARKNLVKTF